MGKVPGKGVEIAGQDYCSYELDGEDRDLDLGPGGLKVEDGSGYAAENDPTR